MPIDPKSVRWDSEPSVGPTHDGLPALKNSDGSYSTELSITVTNPALNGGRPTNIPSLWGRKVLDEDGAVRAAVASKRAFSSFGSIDEAVRAAQARSNAGGAGAPDPASVKWDDAPAGGFAIPKAAPAAVQGGSFVRDALRAPGLALRYGMEALGQTADIAAEPIRAGLNAVAGAVQGPPGLNDLVTGRKPFKFNSSVGQLASGAADAIGLPAPRDANERVIGDASRMVAGGGGLAGGARKAAEVLTGMPKFVMNALAANPGMQVAGAAGAGAAGGSVREAGGGAFEQFAASLAGGLTGGLLPGAATNVAGRVSQALTPKAVELVRADQQISLVLQRAGVDWTQVPERIKQGMRAEVLDALNTGQQLNPDALRRLLVFRRADVTPTVGQLTQDPGMITREKNLAKTGANSTNQGLQTLPGLENRNVGALLRQLDEAGAAGAPTASGAGTASINALDGLVDRSKANINQLYSRARDTSGRSLPLEGGTFSRRANELLDEANVGSFLPADLVNKMNAIAKGEYPLTVDVAEQLKTSAEGIRRNSADGNVRKSISLFRQALDEAPLQPQAKVNPGNLPAVPGTVPASTAGVGEESIAAFNAARRANREWMARVEANPALAAVVDGIEPDKFVQRFVIGDGATAADVQRLRNELNPEALQSMRSYLVRHLKDKATGGDEDIIKFGGKTYRDALKALENKLPVFFSREEIQRLRDLGDAAKYMQSQPAGAAVNNSNSGALVLGRGLDMLEAGAQKVPVVGDTISGWIQGVQQRQVMAPSNALALPGPPKTGARVNALIPAAALAAAPPVYGRKDDRRR